MAVGVEQGAAGIRPTQTYDNETSHPAGEIYGDGLHRLFQKESPQKTLHFASEISATQALSILRKS